MFGLTRKARTAHRRTMIDDVIAELIAARMTPGVPVPVEELPIVQGLVMLIADAIADMELYAVDKPGNHPDAQRVDDEFAILQQPDPDEDRADTVHKIVQSLYWRGNAWSLLGPRTARGDVDSMTVLAPSEVGWLPNPAHSLKVASWQINGVTYSTHDLAWWKINDSPLRGPLGRTPLQVCAQALGMYGWAYRYLADYFGSGGNPSSVMRSKLELSPEKITELSDEWTVARQARRPAFLPNWLEFDVPPAAGEIEAVVAVLEFASAELARMMNVPVSLVNAPVAGYSLQYSNTEDEFRRWLAVSLGTTWVRRVERGFSRLLPEGRWAKLDPAGLFPADLFPGGKADADELDRPPAGLPATGPLPEAVPA